jgi:hypothetical protein
MKIFIEMTPEHYDDFLNRCDPLQPQYAILKKGLIVYRPIGKSDRQMIEIYCDRSQAHKLLDAARALSVPAVQAIERALDPLRDL